MFFKLQVLWAGLPRPQYKQPWPGVRLQPSTGYFIHETKLLPLPFMEQPHANNVIWRLCVGASDMEHHHDAYQAVNVTSVDPRFLASNSTSHVTAFGAIAELIDNAVDPDADAKACVSITCIWLAIDRTRRMAPRKVRIHLQD